MTWERPWHLAALFLGAALLVAFFTLLPGCTTAGPDTDQSADSAGVIHSVTVDFTVNALTQPSVYVFPRKKTIDGAQTKVMVRSKGLPSCYSMKLVFSGVQIGAVESKLASAPNAVLLHSDSTINVGLGPNDQPMAGDMDILELSLATGAIADSAEIRIIECVARDSIRADITLSMLRGCLIVR